MDTLPDLQLVKMPKFLLLEFEMRHQETIKNSLESLGGDAVIKLLYQHFTERFGSVNRTTPTP